MSSTHYVYQCAPVRTPISRKIISIITLFCFCIMTIGQSFATHVNGRRNDWHPAEMIDIAPQLGNSAFFQKLPGRDTQHLSETIDVDPQPENRASFQKIPRRDTISSEHPKSAHFAGRSSSLFRFLFGFLCLYTWLQKACATNLNLASLSIEGISMTGTVSGSQTGWSVSNIGDFNGDGIDDMLIGAPGSNTAYVVYGGSHLTNKALATLSPTDGIIIRGISGSKTGYSVSNAGDVNSDGIADIIIGAYGSSSNTGKVYVILGGSNLTDINLANPGSNVITITGAGINYYTGYSVSSAGDVNGDGIDDILIGAYGYSSSTGKAYVILGGSNLTDTNLANPGSNVITITGAGTSYFTGLSVSNAGDVNGDGIDDILIGASGYSSSTGKAYVILGSRNLADINLANPGSNVITITGTGSHSQTGYSVSSAGDVNNDGISDIIIGAPGYSSSISSIGKAYVILGGRNLADINLANPGSNVITITGAGTSYFTGAPVSSAGDVNGDGIADMLIEAPGHSSVYVILGGSNLADIDLANPGSNVNIITGSGISSSASSAISSAGDVNGDGIDDILIGASTSIGKAYLIYGAASGFVTSSPTIAPSKQPSRQPTNQPTGHPTSAPSAQSSGQPTTQPTTIPSGQPSEQPTEPPSSDPSVQPSDQPTRQPVRSPSAQPSNQPTVQPSVQPSEQPTEQPTEQPSSDPSVQPSGQPTKTPSARPSRIPTRQPTVIPSMQPSDQPTNSPSVQPSNRPTTQPTKTPSARPSRIPTRQPTVIPSVQPSDQPTSTPSVQPSGQPAALPSVQPSEQPTEQPTGSPSAHPSHSPTIHTNLPTYHPSYSPSALPTLEPTTPGNWSSILTPWTSLTSTAAITTNEITLCGGQQCRRFSNWNGQQLPTEQLPWNTTNIISAIDNEVILAGQLNNQSDPSAALVCTDFNRQQFKWGKVSLHNKLSAIDFNPDSNQITAISSNALNVPVAAIFNKASGDLVCEKTIPVQGTFTDIDSIVLGDMIRTYMIGYNDHKILAIGLGTDCSVTSSYSLTMFGTPSTLLNTANSLIIEPDFGGFIFGGTSLQTDTGNTKALIACFGNWAYSFLGGKNSLIKTMLIQNNVLYAMGEATGLGSQTNKSTLILIKMDDHSGTPYDAIQISSLNSEDIFSHSLLGQSITNDLELVFSVGNQTGIISVDTDAFRPKKLPSWLTWEKKDVLASLKASLDFILVRRTALSAGPSDVWSNARDIASYSASSITYTQPSAMPTEQPTPLPVEMPSSKPTSTPTSVPSASFSPTMLPSTNEPTALGQPSKNPSPKPSASTTVIPTADSTYHSVSFPTSSPNNIPSHNSTTPTHVPSSLPITTSVPSYSLTMPTQFPSQLPITTPAPSQNITISPPPASPKQPTKNPSSASTQSTLSKTSYVFIEIVGACIGVSLMAFIAHKINGIFNNRVAVEDLDVEADNRSLGSYPSYESFLGRECDTSAHELRQTTPPTHLNAWDVEDDGNSLYSNPSYDSFYEFLHGSYDSFLSSEENVSNF
jgi:hypothetical protein